MADWDTPAPNDADQFAPGDGFGGGGADDNFGSGNNGFAGRGNDGGNGGGDQACYSCGETGHRKADCPKRPPIVCRACNEEGHIAKECPSKPPMVCRSCGQEGHAASECEAPRLIDRSAYPDMPAADAFKKIEEAALEREVDDVKEAIQTYLKAAPDTTFVDLETKFREAKLSLYIIAVKKEEMGVLTNMDYQGNLGKEFSVTYRFSPNPLRPRERNGWPESPEENLQRLENAGEVVNSGKSKCTNCSEIGHISKNCPQERNVPNTVREIVCFHCGQLGHRVRDCPTPRVDKFACKNCGQPGHKVAECPEPPNPANVECRKCGEIGHFSRDCPQGGGGDRACRNCGQEGHMAKDCTEPRKMICRNCDAEGHMSRECPKPRDYSRVTCSNCGEKGHTKVRCKKPPVADEVGGFDAGNDAGNGGFENPAGFENAGGFENTTGGGNDTWGSGGAGTGTADAW